MTSMSFAQYDVTTVGNSDMYSSNAGLWVVTKGTSDNIGGSLYLLNNWFAKGYLVTREDKILSITGLNYDSKNDAFVVKIAEDSIFMFDDSKLKEVKIDDKKFKKYFNVPNLGNQSKNSYLEVLGSTNDMDFLKYHGKKLKLGRVNPLTQSSTPDEYVDMHKIYFKKGDSINEVKLNKKEICQLFGEKSNEIKKFISKNKISLKEEKNLQKILNYYNSL